MKVVIDSNRAIAALIKDSTTREILFDSYFELFAPEFIKTEIEKYKEEIISKAGIEKEEFEILFSFIFEQITIISQTEYARFIENVSDKTDDPKDIPYFAVCLFVNAEGIWTHDLHFKKQQAYKIYTNIDMLNLSGKSII